MKFNDSLYFVKPLFYIKDNNNYLIWFDVIRESILVILRESFKLKLENKETVFQFKENSVSIFLSFWSIIFSLKYELFYESVKVIPT